MEWLRVEYVEKASGKDRSGCPILAQMLADAHAHKFEAVLVWKLNRFGRSMVDVVHNAQELVQAGVRLLVPSDGIDTEPRSPLGQWVVRFFSLLAELERDLIWERSTRGRVEYRRAHAAGEIGRRRHSKSGKDLAVGRPRRIYDRSRALELRQNGASVREVARAMGIGLGTAARLLAE
jgi:DNA invertase Pin-like site-specific DNA recombinase